MVSQWRTLGWGAGPGPRLWSPGAPTLLLADGARIGWQTRDGLFVDRGAEVGFLSLPRITAMSVSPDCWSVVIDGDAGSRLCWGAPGRPWRARLLPPGRVSVGGAWVRWRRGTRFALTTLEGAPVAAPMGAHSALPWPDGPGASWWEGRYLYRLTETGRVAVAGVLPGEITGGRIGPGGAALLQVGDDLFGVAPGALPAPLQVEAGLTEARLSTTHALLHTHAGAGLFSLCDGALLAEVEGGVPVGFAPDPLIFDEAEGTVCDLEGSLRRAHFLPGAALLRGETLYGPGGGIWDLGGGACLLRDAVLSAEQLLPMEDGVLCVHARELIVLEQDGTLLRRFARPSPGRVQVGSDRLLFAESGRTLIADLSGKVLGATTPHVDDPMHPEPASRWGMQLDGAVALGGREWQWSDDGMLLSF
jgi:hypothetical protein